MCWGHESSAELVCTTQTNHTCQIWSVRVQPLSAKRATMKRICAESENLVLMILLVALSIGKCMDITAKTTTPMTN